MRRDVQAKHLPLVGEPLGARPLLGTNLDAQVARPRGGLGWILEERAQAALALAAPVADELQRAVEGLEQAATGAAEGVKGFRP